jgi:hypothetical protein
VNKPCPNLQNFRVARHNLAMPKGPKSETPKDRHHHRLTLATTAQLYELRVQGLSEEEICNSLRIDVAQLRKLEETLYSEQAFEVATEKPERTFAKYKIEQRRNIRDLDNLVSDLDRNSQYNALIGAIRLRSDLLDRIIETGQKLGVINKPATEHKHSHSGSVLSLVAQMSPSELRVQIKQMGESTREMVDRHGEKPFLELPEGEIYYGEAASQDVKVMPDFAPTDRPSRPRKKKKKLARQSMRIS